MGFAVVLSSSLPSSFPSSFLPFFFLSSFFLSDNVETKFSYFCYIPDLAKFFFHLSDFRSSPGKQVISLCSLGVNLLSPSDLFEPR